MAFIEIKLKAPANELRIRNFEVSADGLTIIVKSFDMLMVMDDQDREEACSLPITSVTLLDHRAGIIRTEPGLYILEGGTNVSVRKLHGASVKFEQIEAWVSINAPSLVAFMDTYALMMNGNLGGLELVPKDTVTYKGVFGHK